MEIKMKPEEAYNLIELCLDYDKDMSDYPERYEMALQIAREVFHKQIPMKPKIVKLFGHDVTTCAGLGCGVGITKEESIFHKSKYCGECGQAIDWSEE